MTEQTTIEQAEKPANDITMLPPAERALIVLNSTKTEQDLRAMAEEAQAIKDVQDKPSRDLAHSVGMKLKKARTTIEKTGKAAREDATAFSKAVIDEEKRLKAIVGEEEDRVLGLRDAYDKKIEAEKEAARQAEERRVAEIREKIEGIRRLPMSLAGEPAEVIEAELLALAGFVPAEDVFSELTGEAEAAVKQAEAAMSDMLAQALAKELAEALLAEERERAARELAEKEAEAQRLQAERDAMAAELAAMRAQLAAAQAPQQQQQPEPEPVVMGIDLAAEQDFSAIVELPVELVRETLAETGVETEPLAQDEPAPEADQVQAAPTPLPIRMAALATADQFAALADKVEACGFGPFASELRAVAYGLREGDHDAKIAAADHAALVDADNRLLDATVQAVDALNDAKLAA